MSQEDMVQTEVLSYFDYSIAATVLTVNKQRGFGALARTGVGTLTVTYPSGKGGQATTDIWFEYCAAGTVMLTLTYSKAASTTLVHQLLIFDNAGAAIDNVPGKIIARTLSF